MPSYEGLVLKRLWPTDSLWAVIRRLVAPIRLCWAGSCFLLFCLASENGFQQQTEQIKTVLILIGVR